MLESTGIGLIYGLKSFVHGKLSPASMVQFIQHNALVLEYYKRSKALVPDIVAAELDETFHGSNFAVLKSTSADILQNNRTHPDLEKGVEYFENSLKFSYEMQAIMRIIRKKIVVIAADDLHDAFLSQVWAVSLLFLIVFLSFLLMTVAKNAMASVRVS